MTQQPINLAVLISGSGTTLQNLVDIIDAGKLSARIKIVIASKSELAGVDRARKAKLQTEIVERRGFTDVRSFSQRVFELIDRAGVDLVCLGGWLCLLEIPEKWHGRIMNIHPSLLPKFGGKGMYGHRVHEAVLSHGCSQSGCTVHFVDDAYDTGPIILQRSCPVKEGDTAADLAHRVFEEEKTAYPEAIRLFAAGKLRIEGQSVRILDQ